MASICTKFHCRAISSLENTRVGHFCPLPPLQIKYATSDTPNKIGLSNLYFELHDSSYNFIFSKEDNVATIPLHPLI